MTKQELSFELQAIALELYDDQYDLGLRLLEIVKRVYADDQEQQLPRKFKEATEPTAEGLRRYLKIDGALRNGVVTFGLDKEFFCTCQPDCKLPCYGRCGCEACFYHLDFRMEHTYGDENIPPSWPTKPASSKPIG